MADRHPDCLLLLLPPSPPNQAVRIAVRQGAKQHAVDHTEDSRFCSDAKHQGKKDGGREAATRFLSVNGIPEFRRKAGDRVFE